MKLPLKILLCVILIELVGGAMALTMGDSLKEWYPALNKPPGTPPNWLFGPAWTLLYGLMGAAVALVWHRAEPSPAKRTALQWFVFQMVLNLVWTPVFFGFHQMLAALVIIVSLWVAILITIRAFRRVDALAGWLLVPYLIWVSYATYLNAGNWWLNR